MSGKNVLIGVVTASALAFAATGCDTASPEAAKSDGLKLTDQEVEMVVDMSSAKEMRLFCEVYEATGYELGFEGFKQGWKDEQGMVRGARAVYDEMVSRC